MAKSLNVKWCCFVCQKQLDPSTTVQFFPNYIACLGHSQKELDEALRAIKNTKADNWQREGEMAAITVRQLKALLNELDDKLIVVLSKDGEGNAFSPMPKSNNYTIGKYKPETTWSGEFHSGEDMQGKPNAVCFWPTN